VHKLSIGDRLARVTEFAGLDSDVVAQLSDLGNLGGELANRLIENVIGTLSIPAGVATNMKVDGQAVLITMATEESSVVAAVCNAGRQCYDDGGFITSMSGSLMIAQIQLVDITNPASSRISILERKDEIKEICDTCDPILVSLGGGLRD